MVSINTFYLEEVIGEKLKNRRHVSEGFNPIEDLTKKVITILLKMYFAGLLWRQ